MCAALCPNGNLEMAWNRYGEYNPAESAPCNDNCGLCQKVCPFADIDINEDTIGTELYGNVPGMKHNPETGYHLASYVGYAEKHRLKSASGGITSWLLETMLSEGIVDRAICVAPTGNPERLFSYNVIDTPDSVHFSAGSAYYPVELSRVIKQVMDIPGRYAITGLPCFIKAIRLAQWKNVKLKERIIATIGLVCGQLKSSHFTDYIATLAGVEGKAIGVRYRGKDPGYPASNYHYAFKAGDEKEKRIYWNEGISEAWTNRWFTPEACNYCDDIFAECSDITCMDAWLPEYSEETLGTSLVLIRSSLMNKILSHGHGLHLETIPIEHVILSQNSVVAIKRRHLAHRLYLNHEKGNISIRKRVAPEKIANPFLRREIALKDYMSRQSREIWITEGPDPERLRGAMRPAQRQQAIGRWISMIAMQPERIFRHAFKK